MREIFNLHIPTASAPSKTLETPSTALMRSSQRYGFDVGITPTSDGLLQIDSNLYQDLFCPEKFEDVYQVDPTPLARGKFATVRRCVNRRTGVEYAAKYIRKRRRTADTSKEIFHEIAVLQQAAVCPYIVNIHHVFDTSNEFVLVLELAKGGDLQTLIDGDEIPSESDLRKCMRQVLRGLQFLHDHNVAHLDIKPQNIVTTGKFPYCDVKLCDFGISRLISEGAEVREILGTPDYVAPEVLNYEPISLATDMWSVGVLLYVLLTGCSPFGGDDKQETYCNITRANVDFPDDIFEGVSWEAKDFILKLLVKDPRKRMTIGDTLRHPWLTSSPSALASPVSSEHPLISACAKSIVVTASAMVFQESDPPSAPPPRSSPRSLPRRSRNPATVSDSLDSDVDSVTSVETIKAADASSALDILSAFSSTRHSRRATSTETLTSGPRSPLVPLRQKKVSQSASLASDRRKDDRAPGKILLRSTSSLSSTAIPSSSCRYRPQRHSCSSTSAFPSPSSEFPSDSGQETSVSSSALLQPHFDLCVSAPVLPIIQDVSPPLSSKFSPPSTPPEEDVSQQKKELRLDLSVSSPLLTRLSSETSSDRSSGIFSDFSELSSDSSSDRSSVVSWDEGHPPQKLQEGDDAGFSDIWDGILDQTLSEGFANSALETKPWNKLCSGAVARAQSAIMKPKDPVNAANSLYCQSLGRSLGSSVQRSMTLLGSRRGSATSSSSRMTNGRHRTPPQEKVKKLSQVFNSSSASCSRRASTKS